MRELLSEGKQEVKKAGKEISSDGAPIARSQPHPRSCSRPAPIPDRSPGVAGSPCPSFSFLAFLLSCFPPKKERRDEGTGPRSAQRCAVTNGFHGAEPLRPRSPQR